MKKETRSFPRPRAILAGMITRPRPILAGIDEPESTVLDFRTRAEEEIEKRWADTVFIVDANDFARHALWREWAKEAVEAGHVSPTPHEKHDFRIEWEQHSLGQIYTIASVHVTAKEDEAGYSLPVCVCCTWVTLGPKPGKTVLFYDATSRLVDWTIVDDWLLDRFKGTWDGNRRARTDATNFGHCVQAVRGMLAASGARG